MFYRIITALVCLAVMVLAPIFVKEQRNGPCPRSLFVKMVAATGYMAVGGLCVAMTGVCSSFDRWMLLGLFGSWIGDLFLHLWQTKVFPAIGFLGFLSAHFFFIAAYWTGVKAMAPDRGFFTLPEIAFVVLFDVFFILFAMKTGLNLKGVIAVPILLYATVITTMLCKAFLLGQTALQTDAPYGIFVAVCAMGGALLFVASDFTISILMFNEKQKKNYPLKMFNIVTYFAAELLLALLIALV